MRIFKSSPDLKEKMKFYNKKRAYVYSFYPIDKYNCDCQKMLKNFKDDLVLLNDTKKQRKLEEAKFLECPRSKIGMTRYKIICNFCNAVQGYLWAKDETLKDWCDFHYLIVSDGDKWVGCVTPHISPITQELCFECSCGNDTRDFRANNTMSAKQAFQIEKENSKGRLLGQDNSKFRAIPVQLNELDKITKDLWRK